MADNNKGKNNGVWLNGLSQKQVVPAKKFKDGQVLDEVDPNRVTVTVYDKDGHGYLFGAPVKSVAEKDNGKRSVFLYEATNEAGEPKPIANVWKFTAGVENSGERVSMFPAELKALWDENLQTSIAANKEAEAPEVAESKESKYGAPLRFYGLDTINHEHEKSYSVPFFNADGQYCEAYVNKDWYHPGKKEDGKMKPGYLQLFEKGSYNVRRSVEGGGFETIQMEGAEIHEGWRATQESQRKYAKAMAANETEAEAPEAPEVEDELEV